jgi:hypothetical protein
MKDLLAQYNALAAKPIPRWRKGKPALEAAIAALQPKPARRGGVDSSSGGGGEPKAPRIMNIAPKAEAKPCRENTNQALVVDLLHKGATIAEMTKAVNAQRLAGGKPNAISEAVIRGTISYDVCSVKGYGVRGEQQGTEVKYFLVLPTGLTAPRAHQSAK